MEKSPSHQVNLYYEDIPVHDDTIVDLFDIKVAIEDTLFNYKNAEYSIKYSKKWDNEYERFIDYHAVRLIIMLWPVDCCKRDEFYVYLCKLTNFRLFSLMNRKDRLSLYEDSFTKLNHQKRDGNTYFTAIDRNWLGDKLKGEFYSMAISEATPLIAKRRVLLKKGTALVHEDDMAVIIGHKTKTMLQAAFKDKRVEYCPQELDRFRVYIQHFITTLHKQIERETVKLEFTRGVDTYPICMQRYLDTLRLEGRLVNQDRIIFIPVMADSGASLEHTTNIMRSAYLKRGLGGKNDFKYAYENLIKYFYDNRKGKSEKQCSYITTCPYHGDSMECLNMAKMTGLISEDVQTFRSPSAYMKHVETHSKESLQGETLDDDYVAPSA